MNRTVLRAGIGLGLGVAAWTFFMGVTRWYRDPALSTLFFVVVPLEIGVVVWAMIKAREDAPGYLALAGRGTLVGVVAAPIVFVQSLLFTTVAFPNYFAELRELHGEALRRRGLPEAEVQAALAETAPSQTPLSSAGTGAVATIVTGAVTAFAAAALLRSKQAAKA